MKNKKIFIACLAAFSILIGSFTVLQAHSDTWFTTDDTIAHVLQSMKNNSYEDNMVLVTMKSEYQSWHKEYSADDFPEIELSSIQSLTYIPADVSTELAANNYQHILAITLKNSGEKAIKKCIKALSKRDDVQIAEPNYTHILQTKQEIEAMQYTKECTCNNNNTTNVTNEGSSTPNDPLFANQAALEIIEAPAAWQYETGSKEVTVGILDSGIDIYHEDLKDNIWVNPGEIPGDGIDNDGNGFIDDVNGWNFIDNNNDVTDINHHGTAIAGIVGAVGNNGTGMTGVCQTISLVPLRIGYIDEEGNYVGSSAAALEAIKYATENEIDILNFSYSSDDIPLSLASAIQNYQGIFVTSAGNQSQDNDINPNHPQTTSFSNVIKVASTDSNDKLSEFSNYGISDVSLAAPGENIVGTYPDNVYNQYFGTSYSTPLVTGAAALVKAHYPEYTYLQIKEILLSSVDTIPALENVVASGGRLNLRKLFETQ